MMLPSAQLGSSLVDILSATQLASSKTEARRLIKSGAISVNRAKITDETATVNSLSIIKKGKNKFAIVK